MDIKYNSYTELIKGDNGACVIVKSTVPTLFSGDGREKINDFYIKLCEAHRAIVREAVCQLSGGMHRLTVECSVSEKQSVISVLRRYSYISSSKAGKSVLLEDFFSATDGTVIKKGKIKKKKQGL